MGLSFILYIHTYMHAYIHTYIHACVQLILESALPVSLMRFFLLRRKKIRIDLREMKNSHLLLIDDASLHEAAEL